jgi:hypothetical protein
MKTGKAQKRSKGLRKRKKLEAKIPLFEVTDPITTIQVQVSNLSGQLSPPPKK